MVADWRSSSWRDRARTEACLARGESCRSAISCASDASDSSSSRRSFPAGAAMASQPNGLRQAGSSPSSGDMPPAEGPSWIYASSATGVMATGIQ